MCAHSRALLSHGYIGSAVENRDLISLDEAVLQFQVSKTTLYKWVRAGELKRFRRAGDRRTFVSSKRLAELTRWREVDE